MVESRLTSRARNHFGTDSHVTLLRERAPRWAHVVATTASLQGPSSGPGSLILLRAVYARYAGYAGHASNYIFLYRDTLATPVTWVTPHMRLRWTHGLRWLRVLHLLRRPRQLPDISTPGHAGHAVYVGYDGRVGYAGNASYVGYTGNVG